METVKRFVVTFVSDKDGMRTLAFPCQGKWTFATWAEADETRKLFSGPDGLARVLSPAEVASLEVREAECWRGHFDPCGIYFDN